MSPIFSLFDDNHSIHVAQRRRFRFRPRFEQICQESFCFVWQCSLFHRQTDTHFPNLNPTPNSSHPLPNHIAFTWQYLQCWRGLQFYLQYSATHLPRNDVAIFTLEIPRNSQMSIYISDRIGPVLIRLCMLGFSSVFKSPSWWERGEHRVPVFVVTSFFHTGIHCFPHFLDSRNDLCGPNLTRTPSSPLFIWVGAV